MDASVNSSTNDNESSSRIFNSSNLESDVEIIYSKSKLKYVKNVPVESLLDGSNINITKYKLNGIEKLKQKYESEIKPEKLCIDYDKINIEHAADKRVGKNNDFIRKKKSRLRTNRKLDPEVNDISNLLHASLLIESKHNAEENELLRNVRGNEINSNCNSNRRNMQDEANRNKKKPKHSPNKKSNYENVETMKINSSPIEKYDTENSTPEKKNVQTDDTPTKNAFQFMMDSRHRSIGTNSPGRDRVEDCTDPSVQTEQRDKLHGRRQLLQDWAEQRGGHKRKIDEHAKDKFIEHALAKRAKRMKNMLSVRRDSREHDADITSKSRKKCQVLSESEDSNDSHNCAAEGDCSAPEEDVVFPPSVHKATQNDDIILSPSLKKTSLLHYFDVRTNKNVPSSVQFPCGTRSNSEHLSSLIKVKLNFTPKKTKHTRQSAVDENHALNSSSKKIKKKHKRSLSLRKNKENLEKQEDGSAAQLHDAILPLKQTEETSKESNVASSAERTHKTNKYTLSLKKTNDKNATGGETEKTSSVKKGSKQFTPRAWKMRLKFVDKEDTGENVGRKEEEEPEKIEPDGTSEDEIIICDDDEIFPEKDATSETRRRAVKIAPLFLMSRKSEVLAANEAKRKFLHSGVPSRVKHLLHKQPPTNNSGDDADLEHFPHVSHVQQRDGGDAELWDLPNTSLVLPDHGDTTVSLELTPLHLGSITRCTAVPYCARSVAHCAPLLSLPDLKHLVKQLKRNNPEYPVYRVFRLLHGKCGARFMSNVQLVNQRECQSAIKSVKKKRGTKRRPKKNKVTVDDNSEIIKLDDSGGTSMEHNEKLAANVSMWTEKYKPQSSEDIIGNVRTVAELQVWLQSWIDYSTVQKANGRRKRLDSNSSDDFSSDSDTSAIPQNTTILVGPYGSGKTSAVYALCYQLNINVIEINASSRRPGKKILSDLQEATKSHQVKNTDVSSVDGFFQKLKPNKTDDENKKLTLLLVEDSDVVFDDQDEGFMNGVCTLITSSKRPIVITSSDANCGHLQKLMSQHRVLVFRSVRSVHAGPWLQLLCLVEGARVDGTRLAQLLDWNRGDVRKTLLQLQFWVSTGGDAVQVKHESTVVAAQRFTPHRRTSVELDVTHDDEHSNLSWVCEEQSHTAPPEHDDTKLHSTCTECFVPYFEKDNYNFHLPYPVDLGNIWWSLSPIYSGKSKTVTSKDIKEVCSQTSKDVLFCTQESSNSKVNDCQLDKTRNDIAGGTENEQHEIESSILFCAQKFTNTKSNSLIELQSLSDILDSLAYADVAHTKMRLQSDLQPYRDYWRTVPVNSVSLNETKSSYCSSDETATELTHWLVENTLLSCGYGELCTDVGAPCGDERRWQDRQRVCLEQLSETASVCAQTDRRAVCADYAPALRDMCRSERARCADSGKRNNRFYHYLRSLGAQLSDSDTRAACATFRMS